jgi:pimeloyl-ACP methyl ester carboxylesterase
MQPTIVLVHGAFAESASWDAVIDQLLDAGHPVIAAPNPLRSVAGDAAEVADVLRAVDGPVVLAAHSYGGAVMSNVPADAGDIVGIVYIDGFAPESGETCFALAGKFPGSQIGETTLRPVPRSDGTTDLFIQVDSFHDVFCQDLSGEQAARMAATQRPVALEGTAVVVLDRRGRPSHSARRSALHGGARRRSPRDRDPRRLARRSRLAPERDRASDPRGRRGTRGCLTAADEKGSREMSVHTHAHVLMEQAAEESRHEADAREYSGAADRPPVGELVRRVVAGIFFIPLAGPPVLLLLVPWLLLVLLIIPPAAFLITLVLLLVVAGGVLAAVATLIASPFLLAH